MKKLKKTIGSLMVWILPMILLAGCGGDSTDNTGDADGKKEESGKKDIKISAMILPDDKPMLTELANSFEKENPGTVIDLIEVPSNEYEDKVVVQLSGGADIDIIFAASNPSYANYISKDLLIPLDDYVKEDNVDMSSYGPTYEGVKNNNQLYMMPVRNSEWVLYYNKDLFDAAGVEYPKSSMSYSEYRELAKTMTSGSGTDKIYGAYIHTWPISWSRYAIQSGSTIIDKDLSPFVEALQFRVDMEADGSILPYTEQIATSAHYKSEFLKGNLAMHIMGDFHVGQLREAEKSGELTFDWDIVSSPVPEGVAPDTTTGMPAGLCITKNSKNTDIAWKFINYVSGVEGAKVYAKAGFVPSFINDDVKEIIKYDGVTKPENISILLNQKVYVESPAISGISQVDKIFDEESQLVFAGEQTPQEAIDKIAKRISEVTLGE